MVNCNGSRVVFGNNATKNKCEIDILNYQINYIKITSGIIVDKIMIDAFNKRNKSDVLSYYCGGTGGLNAFSYVAYDLVKIEGIYGNHMIYGNSISLFKLTYIKLTLFKKIGKNNLSIFNRNYRFYLSLS